MMSVFKVSQMIYTHFKIINQSSVCYDALMWFSVLLMLREQFHLRALRGRQKVATRRRKRRRMWHEDVRDDKENCTVSGVKPLICGFALYLDTQHEYGDIFLTETLESTALWTVDYIKQLTWCGPKKSKS